MDMDQYLEDKMLSSIKRRDENRNQIPSEEDTENEEGEGSGGGDLASSKIQHKQRLSMLALNLHKETRQAESEVEDCNDDNESSKQEQESPSSKLNDKKSFPPHYFKFNYREFPRVHKQYRDQYNLSHGYSSDTNEDSRLEEQSLRLCQFLLLLDNNTYQFFNNEREQETTEGSYRIIPTSQNFIQCQNANIAIEKKISDSVKFDNVDNNTSMIIDSYTNSQNDEQSNIQTNQLILDQCTAFDAKPALLKLNHGRHSLQPMMLRSLSLTEKRQSLKKVKSKLQRANTYEIDRTADTKNTIKKKVSLREYINNFVNEKRKYLQVKTTKKVLFRQQSWRDLDFSNPSDFKTLVRRITKSKQQANHKYISLLGDLKAFSQDSVFHPQIIQGKINSGRNSGLSQSKSRGSGAAPGFHMNESDKKYSPMNLSSSLSITDENFSMSENDLRSNASESGTPANKYIDPGKNYQKSKFHQSKKMSRDQKSEENDTFSQTQHIMETEISSFDINNKVSTKLIQEVEKAGKLKKERSLQTLLERIKKAVNELVYIYNYFRVTDLIFMEEEQCPSSMYSSIAKRSFRASKILKFGETVFSSTCIQDSVQQQKGMDITSPSESRASQFLFEDGFSLRKKSETICSTSPKEYPMTDGLGIEPQSAQNMNAFMLLSFQGSLQNQQQKAISDRFLPLYNLLKQLQILDSYQKVIVNQSEEIKLLRNLENIVQAEETCNKIRLKTLILKSSIISQSTPFLELSKFLNTKYNIWKLKRWFASFKKRKTIHQRAQLLESMQNKKTICRICEKEILMTNMKKHSINCKQLNELNQQLKAQLKEMNSSLFYFFQQNRELQVQYTLIQKTLEKMILNQQMLIQSRQKNQSQQKLNTNGRIQSPRAVSVLENNEIKLKSISPQRRRFTCSTEVTKNQLIIHSVPKDIKTPVEKFVKENTDNKVNDMMTNSEILPEINVHMIDSSTAMDKSDMRYSVEVISQSDKVRPIAKKLIKNASIIIQEQLEEQQADNIFSNSLPNFQSQGRSTSSIATNYESRSQLTDTNDKSEKATKQLPDILEEESVTSPLPYPLKANDGSDSTALKYQHLDTLIIQKITDKIEKYSPTNEVQELEDENKETESDRLIAQPRSRNSTGQKSIYYTQVEQQENCKEDENQVIVDEYEKDTNTLQLTCDTKTKGQTSQNMLNKMYDMRYKISGTKYINGVPLIQINQEQLSQSQSSIQLSASNSLSFKDKCIFDSQNLDYKTDNNNNSNNNSNNNNISPIKQTKDLNKKFETLMENINLQSMCQYQSNYQIDDAQDSSLKAQQILSKKQIDLAQINTIKSLQDSSLLFGVPTESLSPKKIKESNAQFPTIQNKQKLVTQYPFDTLKKSGDNKSNLLNSSEIYDLYHQSSELMDTSSNNLQINSIQLEGLSDDGNVNTGQKYTEIPPHRYNKLHLSHSPLQPITEQKVEIDIQEVSSIKQKSNETDYKKTEYCSSYTESDKNNNNNNQGNNNGLIIHQFSSSSLSSSLSEIDLMVADFFKKIQLKNENERHFINKLNIPQDQNQVGSQWVFSQDFSPSSYKLFNQPLNQGTFNYIDQHFAQSHQKSSNIDTEMQKERDHSPFQFSDCFATYNKQTNQQVSHKKANLDIPTTKTLPHQMSSNEMAASQPNSKSNMEGIEDSNKITLSNVNYTNSLNIITSKPITFYGGDQQSQPFETENGNSDNKKSTLQCQQQQSPINQNDKKVEITTHQTQEKPKKIVLQKLVSIDCQSVNSSTSNISNPKSKKDADSSMNNNNSNQNLQNSSCLSKQSQENPVHEVVPRGTLLSLYSTNSRKSIRLNTIDIVTSDLNDCFHTSTIGNASSGISIQMKDMYDEDNEDSQIQRHSSKYKDNGASSSSPKAGFPMASFSQSRGLKRQDSYSGKQSKQKSIFGQKFSKQRSESFNMSEEDMCQSEFLDQVPDLSTQKLMKMKQIQKKARQNHMQQDGCEEIEDADMYEEEDNEDDQETEEIVPKKPSKSNQGNSSNISSDKEINSTNEKIRKSEGRRHHKSHNRHQHGSHNQKYTEDIDIKNENTNSNINIKTQSDDDKLDAKDLSYISQTSSSSQALKSQDSSFSSSQSSSSSSNQSRSFDSDSDSSDNNNNVNSSHSQSIDEDSQKPQQRAKTPQITRRQINIKNKGIKVNTDMKRKSKKKNSKEDNVSLTPSPQKNFKRRQSLPLQLLIDLKSNGSKNSEIQKDIVQLSTNFEIKIKQHEKYQCQTKLRITNLVQSLGKIFIIQDFKSTAQQKMQSLSENEKRIEFLLKKISICNFKAKVQEIVKLFNERYKLIQQIESIEKIIQSTLFLEKKRDGEVSDHSNDSEPKSPQLRNIKRRFARSGTYNGKQYQHSKNHGPDDLKHSALHTFCQKQQAKQFQFNQNELIIPLHEVNSEQSPLEIDQPDASPNSKKKLQSDIMRNRKLKTSQGGMTERRSSHQKINFENMLSKQIEKEEDLKVEKLDEFLPKNSGYSSDGVLDNPYSSCGPKDKSEKEAEQQLYLLNFNDNKANRIPFKSKNSVGIKDFDFLKLISKGAFGRVWLVKKKNTEDIYAMKIVNFAEKMNKNHLDSLKKENDILSKVQGDYVVKAVYTFTHESYICFVMEYMIGGDLGSIIQTYGVLEECVARFYIAEIVLAVHNLHQIGIIHRDLKPDNLLLDSHGHLKLTDFGLSDMGLQRRNKSTNEKKKAKLKIFNNLQRNSKALQKNIEDLRQYLTDKQQSKQKRAIPQEILEMKRNVDSLNLLKIDNKVQKQANRIIGTPDYIAPEILRGEGLQNPCIDWWSVGVMLFELLIGIPPFNDDSVEKIFDNIKNFRIAWDDIPVGDGEEEVSLKAINLMKKLLHPDPKLRLGSQSIIQIQSDPFFVGVDWSNLKKMPAPIIPAVKNIFDTSNFNTDKVYQEGEQIDPFFGLPKGIETVNEAKKLLDKTGFSVKRYDVLFEENQKHIEKEEIQMQKMVKELEEQEKEIELIENECGGDQSDDETFQECDILTSTRNRATSSVVNTQVTKSVNFNKKNSHELNISPLCEPQFSKFKVQDDSHA